MSTATISVQQRSTKAGLFQAVASEWTKLLTVRSSWFNVIGGAALTGLLAIQFGFSTAYDNEHLVDGRIAEKAAVGGVGISAVIVVQVVVAAFAMLPVTSEYATGSIRSTLQWTPVRRNVLLGKAVVLAPVLFAYGLLLAAIAAVAGGITMGEWADWDLATLVVDLVSIAAYLTLAGLFTAGIAFLIRSTSRHVDRGLPAAARAADDARTEQHQGPAMAGCPAAGRGRAELLVGGIRPALPHTQLRRPRAVGRMAVCWPVRGSCGGGTPEKHLAIALTVEIG